MNETIIRPEKQGDRDAVAQVNLKAFDTRFEADLVDRLRKEASPLVSLVAETRGAVVGHILFTPVELEGHPDLHLMGLAPMAVLPEFQRRGIGSMLVAAGLKACTELGFGAVVVLGHPGYYPRFGFGRAAEFGLENQWAAPDDAFMVLELEPGCFAGRSGMILFHPAFG